MAELSAGVKLAGHSRAGTSFFLYCHTSCLLLLFVGLGGGEGGESCPLAPAVQTQLRQQCEQGGGI